MPLAANHSVLPRRTAILGLASIPFAVLVFLVSRCMVDVPYVDQWHLVPLLEKSYGGVLTWADLWRLHNEHRMFFPRLIMIGLAHATHWNIAYEIATSLALAVGIFAILVWQAWTTGKQAQIQAAEWSIPLVSLLVFSLSQWENWLWGWQIQVFLCLLGAAGGIVLLAVEPLSWARLWGAAACGILSAYSYGDGLAFWPVGLCLIFLGAGSNKKATIRLGLVWFLCSAAVFWLYFHDFRTPIELHSPRPDLRSAGACLLFVLAFLGSPVLQHSPLAAAAAGLMGVALFTFAAWMSVKVGSIRFRLLFPYVGLALFALGSASITAIGRVHLGLEPALYSRYVSFASLLWVADGILCATLLAVASRMIQPRLFAVCQSAGILAVLILTAAVAYRDASSVPKFRGVNTSLLGARDALISGAEDARLLRLYPDINVLRTEIQTLKSLRLSVFREGASSPR